MSKHRSLPLVLPLLASLSLLAAWIPAPASAAGSSPLSSGDQTRPRAMRLAAATPGIRAAGTASACPAPQPYSGPRPKREVFGFVQAGALCSERGYQTYNYGALTTIAYFGLHINQADGSVVQASTDTGWRVWQTPDVDAMVQVAHASGVRAVLSVIYQDDGPGMCTALQHSATTVGQITAQVQGRHLDGVNIDYEGLNAPCGSTDNRSLLRGLAQGLRNALGPGANLTVDTYAGSASDSKGFYDIPGMAPAINSFFVMAYDLDGSSAGGNWTHSPLNCTRYCLSPNSPLTGYYWNDTRIVAEYSAAAGPGKTILGLPYYGYTACTDAAGPNAYPSATPGWGTPTYADSASTINDPAYAPYASFRDRIDPTSRYDTFHNATYGCTRESYWNDDASLAAKYDLVNRSGIQGVGIFSLDYGGGAAELWSQLAGHFTLRPAAPLLVVPCATASTVEVGWSAAASSTAPVTAYTVTAQPGGASITVAGTVTEVSFTGLTGPGPYTFTVAATNSYGQGPSSDASAGAAPSPASEAYSGYFNWYDRQSPGMTTDNLHLVNPGSTAVTGCAILPGVAVAPFSVPGGVERYLSFDSGSIGGPVRVIASGRVVASQRVAYFRSFNEVAARTLADAATDQYFNWYDNASPGMTTDMIHTVNPGAQPATVTVAIPGAASLAYSLAPGEERYGAFPPGTIGGPVRVTSTSPVLASQRVAYYSSFNEVPATPASRASATIYFNWYDRQSPGMNVDNVHLVNPGAGVAAGTVSLGGGGHPLAFSLGPGQEQFVSFPAGTIGGPVTVQATAPVIASQRVSYFNSFNEVAGRSVLDGAQTLLFNWYDSQSPGMFADNVHLLNPGPGPLTGTIAIPGAAPIPVSLESGQEGYFAFPAGTIGGPITVQTSAPVLASQRVSYYQSFNEVSGQN